MGRVVAVCGLPGSGKGVFCARAVDRNIPVLSMGDVVREEVAARGLTESPENVGRVALQLRTLFGEDVIAERLQKELLTVLNTESMIIIDGIRSLAEYTFFSERIENISLLAIVALRETRKQRISHRGRGEDGNDLDFENREARELGWGIETLIEISDESIANNHSLEEAKERFDEWLEVSASI